MDARLLPPPSPAAALNPHPQAHEQQAPALQQQEHPADISEADLLVWSSRHAVPALGEMEEPDRGGRAEKKQSVGGPGRKGRG